jgi:hypothetical protein
MKKAASHRRTVGEKQSGRKKERERSPAPVQDLWSMAKSDDPRHAALTASEP